MPISFQRDDRKFKPIDDAAGYSTKDELQEKIKAYQELVSICSSKNIQLILAIAPRYAALNHSFVNRLKDLSGPEVKFFQYNQNEPVYRNQAYFFDEGHLKINGAKIFTAEFGEWMRKEVYPPERKK
jgi:hypothetical protein